MKNFIFILLITLLLPTSTLAARAPSTFSAGSSLLAASSSPGNAYVAGASVVLTAPVTGDFLAGGGSVITVGSIAGDALLVGGSVQMRAPVSGDLRAAGGNILIEESVAGDVAAAGYSVIDTKHAGGSVFIVAANVELQDGASGPVVIYGNNIALGGTFAEDVTITASGRISLAPDTLIQGSLTYQAPEPAFIPESVTIMGGVDYTSASYLPDPGTSRVLALVSVGLFLLVRILGALILAGLLAGLFPRFAEVIVEQAYESRARSILLTMLLGFAILVAAPMLLLLLSLTFVGIGLAFLLAVLYVLLLILSVVYAGILLGSMFARRFAHRDTILWRDGVLGMLALSFIILVPFIGGFVVFLLTLFTAGTLLRLFFHFAFPHEESTTPELL